ncbi:hypothetical protein STH46 [Symbiobacterium thermophilum IAM 14863]|uniref:Uncharacterized protein n=1 Tax=Symbiobacterium thermophilum (strain DSM 24528 / JCM 14929 / IAM 14863 / T) TaxID=292459 RepID=Q67TG2_SYMTH|nr:hypothetical protein STH46 [Symbiobacterium thermophilum IAM 14863]
MFGSGQERPEHSNRRSMSSTVLCEIERLRAIYRAESPTSHFKRRISLILRIDNLRFAKACPRPLVRRCYPQFGRSRQNPVMVDHAASL